MRPLLRLRSEEEGRGQRSVRKTNMTGVVEDGTVGTFRVAREGSHLVAAGSSSLVKALMTVMQQ